MALKKTTKARVLAEASRICVYCEGFADTVDHRVPRSLGGRNGKDNLQACCLHCNLERGSLVPHEAYARFVRRFGRPPKGWSKATNRYVLRAMGRMLDGVSGERFLSLARTRFPDKADRLMLRLLRVRGVLRGDESFFSGRSGLTATSYGSVHAFGPSGGGRT